MSKEIQYNIAEEFNIISKIKVLESELLNIEGVKDVDFDLYGFYDNMNQIIFLTKYDIQNDDNYFNNRKKLINEVLEVARKNGLSRTDDNIEDYGEHFYFVTNCKGWLK